MGNAIFNRDTVRLVLVRSRFWPRVLPPGFGRLMDILLSLGLLVFFAPLMLLVAGAVLLDSGAPVVFAHRRIGLGGRTFNVLKFRSMVPNGDAVLAAHLQASPPAAAEWERNHKLKVDPRVTPLGQFLRRSSLDELPQLINVLRGEMCLVGPRPIVQAEVVRYGRFFEDYCSVRPGMTGIWQVSGRNDVSYRRRVAMDALYARRKSVALDLALLLATVPAVLRRKGSY